MMPLPVFGATYPPGLAQEDALQAEPCLLRERPVSRFMCSGYVRLKRRSRRRSLRRLYIAAPKYLSIFYGPLPRSHPAIEISASETKMRLIRSTSGEPTHDLLPEVLIEVLACIVLLCVLSRLSPAPIDQACSPRLADRAVLLCSVRGEPGHELAPTAAMAIR